MVAGVTCGYQIIIGEQFAPALRARTRASIRGCNPVRFSAADDDGDVVARRILDRLRLFLFLVFTLLLLLPLSYFVGFERTGGTSEDALDAIVAFGVGALASAVMLAVFGIIDLSVPASEIIGKISIQTVPASIGAIVARDQLGSAQVYTASKERKAGYAGQLFIMLAGAVFLAFNVAHRPRKCC